ncbi:Uncharacterised protein [Legionella beliardensis]|uniref:DUF4124 domain-containing protein n=1 Tax=Legionella beliardensis TaxID=91822 RepID=A0A378I235_9GAMM|nr:DUF4124 domain-containing protein [Legionella beliardensis]STX29012.1 Uncharacterised protein [Legionella beliardensis]
MIKIIISLLFSLIISPLHAEIYKWTDSQGVVHFSDEPHPGAEKVTLPPIETTAPQPKPTTPAATTNNASAAAATHEYESIVISQPKTDSTIRNNQGYVSVVVNIEPDLQPGDALQLLFDGQPIGKPQANKIFTLNNVNRGTHTIAVQVVGADGSVLEASDKISIHMQRPRVGMVPQTRPANNAP